MATARYTWLDPAIQSLIGCVESEENRKVLVGKKEKGENTSGDSKTTAFKRIGRELFASERMGLEEGSKAFKALETVHGNRVKSKWEGLLKEYKVQAARMTVTGGGIGGDLTEDQAEAMLNAGNHSSLYVPPNGPEEDTPPEAVNLWQEINGRFPYFARIHALVSTRPNMVPIAITTGAGPYGVHTVYPQPPSPTATPRSNPSSAHIASATPDPAPTQPSTPVGAPEPLPLLTTPTAATVDTRKQADKPAKKGSAKPTPPLPSNQALQSLQQAAQQRTQKRGLEQMLLSFQESAQQMQAARADEQARIRRREIGLEEVKCGIITIEEYRRLYMAEPKQPQDQDRRSKKRKTGEFKDLDDILFDSSSPGGEEEDELDSEWDLCEGEAGQVASDS